MAIFEKYDYAPFDESDPDDFRPNSRWALSSTAASTRARTWTTSR